MWLERICRGALDLVLPHSCTACEREVAARGLLCAACFGRVSVISQPFCRCCGAPFESREFATRSGVCEFCALDPPEFGRARAVFLYDEHSRGLVLAFKHADRTDLARTLAPFLLRAGRELVGDADLIVPVPLHRRRLIARRYNQAALLALELGRLAHKPVLVDALTRRKATKSLGHLGRAERALELAGAFTASADPILGRRLLLVDDVMTTGATARGCARCLLSAGAATVDVLTVAHVL